MPMAGEGSRFLKEGWTTPKPLILLHDKPLFMHAINSVKIDGVKMKYSFVLRSEHIKNHKLDISIREILPQANIFSVEKTTRGAVETCLVAEAAIADDDAIIVMDCDLEFKSKRFEDVISEAVSHSVSDTVGGALVSFNADSPKHS